MGIPCRTSRLGPAGFAASANQSLSPAVELAHKDANGDVLDVANVHERRPLLAVVLQVALYAVVVLLKVVTAVVFVDKLER